MQLTRRAFLALAVGAVAWAAAPSWAEDRPRDRWCYEDRRFKHDCPCYDQGLSRRQQSQDQIGVRYERRTG